MESPQTESPQTEYSQNEKKNIMLLGIIYEFIFVRYVGDQTKAGFLQKMLESGDFDQADIMCRDLDNLSLDDLKGPEETLIKSIVSSYKEHGVGDEFVKDVNEILMNDEIFIKKYNNPIFRAIFGL